MKTIDQVIEYLEERRLDLIELRNESSGHLWSAYDGGMMELFLLDEFINEEEKEN